MTRQAMQRCFNFQIQRVQSVDAISQIELLLHSLNAQAKTRVLKLSIDFCPNENYCNVFVESSNPIRLWRDFSAFVAENAKEFEWIKKRWIVVLQGESGWDDYLMLAHFDSSVRLDAVEHK